MENKESNNIHSPLCLYGKHLYYDSDPKHV